MLKKQEKDNGILKIIPLLTNLCVVMDDEVKGSIWDVRSKKMVRQIPYFTGVCTMDGRLGLHAPIKGGLDVISPQFLYYNFLFGVRI